MKPHYEINSSPNFVVQHPMEHNYIEDENGKKGQVLGLEFEFPPKIAIFCFVFLEWCDEWNWVGLGWIGLGLGPTCDLEVIEKRRNSD